MRRSLLLVLLLSAACISATPLYPPRPPASPGLPIADPPPSRIVAHATVTAKALGAAMSEAIPDTGRGTFPLLGKERAYSWERDPLALSFGQGRIGVATRIRVRAELPVGHLEITLDARIAAEPVITSEYVARMQSIEVAVSSPDAKVKVADALAGVLEKVRAEVTGRVAAFSYDLRPMMNEAYARLTKPIDLPLGDAHGCASLVVLGVEAGPTVLADGVEKDFALVVTPQITLPCAPAGDPPPLPPLANVASIPSGPFTVKIPIAARYDELAKAMSLTFTDGRYHFSKEFPGLYMEHPEVYAAKDELVLKVRIRGPVHKLGGDHELDGDLYLVGHPAVVDNEVRIPDLEPTIETKSFLLKMKALLEGDEIRDSARAALRLDLGERLAGVRKKLGADLSFASGEGCARADVVKIEIAGVHPHGEYLRVQVEVTARAAAYLPCPP